MFCFLFCLSYVCSFILKKKKCWTLDETFFVTLAHATDYRAPQITIYAADYHSQTTRPLVQKSPCSLLCVGISPAFSLAPSRNNVSSPTPSLGFILVQDRHDLQLYTSLHYAVLPPAEDVETTSALAGKSQKPKLDSYLISPPLAGKYFAMYMSSQEVAKSIASSAFCLSLTCGRCTNPCSVPGQSLSWKSRTCGENQRW